MDKTEAVYRRNKNATQFYMNRTAAFVVNNTSNIKKTTTLLKLTGN